MTNTTTVFDLLAQEEMFAWANHAFSVGRQVEDMFLGNAQGGEADLDDYEVRQMMAGGF